MLNKDRFQVIFILSVFLFCGLFFSCEKELESLSIVDLEAQFIEKNRELLQKNSLTNDEIDNILVSVYGSSNQEQKEKLTKISQLRAKAKQETMFIGGVHYLVGAYLFNESSVSWDFDDFVISGLPSSTVVAEVSMREDCYCYASAEAIVQISNNGNSGPWFTVSYDETSVGSLQNCNNFYSLNHCCPWKYEFRARASLSSSGGTSTSATDQCVLPR